jgi:hypothetical protein
MTEPTEQEVLSKAKQLAYDDGRLWDAEDFEDAPPEARRASRRRFASRRISEPARELLRHEKI